MRAVRMLALPLLIVLAVPAPAWGQSLSSRAMEEINAAALVRVHLVKGKRRTLYAPQADSDSLRYQSRRIDNRRTVVQLPRALAMADITRIERRMGTNAWKGAKIGGSIYGGLALLASYGPPDTFGGASSTRDRILGVGVYALSGALLGAMIGSASTRWKTVYRAP